MKLVKTASAALFAALLMAACGHKETAAAPEAAAPAAPAAAAPATAAPAAAAPANSEDASQTSGDKVGPTAPTTPPTG